MVATGPFVSIPTIAIQAVGGGSGTSPALLLRATHVKEGTEEQEQSDAATDSHTNNRRGRPKALIRRRRRTPGGRTCRQHFRHTDRCHSLKAGDAISEHRAVGIIGRRILKGQSRQTRGLQLPKRRRVAHHLNVDNGETIARGTRVNNL